jgi:hypothetical protein
LRSRRWQKSFEKLILNGVKMNFTLQGLIDRLEQIKIEKNDPLIQCAGVTMFYKHATVNEPHRIEFYDYDANINSQIENRRRTEEIDRLYTEIRSLNLDTGSGFS